MDDCIFCKIVNGEIPSEKVYEDEKVLAFKDINPVTPIHVLIIPKKHFKDVLDVKEEDKEIIADLFQSINKIAKTLGIEKNGFRIVNNCGEDAGQEVMHLHFHLLAGKKLGTKII